MSTDSDDDGGGGELPDEQADALLDQLAERADERDDIDLRPGSKRKISRRSLLGAVGAAGVGALSMSSQTAEAQTGQWGNATGQAGTEQNPFSEGWVQDLHSQSISTGALSPDPDENVPQSVSAATSSGLSVAVSSSGQSKVVDPTAFSADHEALNALNTWLVNQTVPQGTIYLPPRKPNGDRWEINNTVPFGDSSNANANVSLIGVDFGRTDYITTTINDGTPIFEFIGRDVSGDYTVGRMRQFEGVRYNAEGKDAPIARIKLQTNFNFEKCEVRGFSQAGVILDTVANSWFDRLKFGPGNATATPFKVENTTNDYNYISDCILGPNVIVRSAYDTVIDDTNSPVIRLRIGGFFENATGTAVFDIQNSLSRVYWTPDCTIGTTPSGSGTGAINFAGFRANIQPSRIGNVDGDGIVIASTLDIQDMFHIGTNIQYDNIGGDAIRVESSEAHGVVPYRDTLVGPSTLTVSYPSPAWIRLRYPDGWQIRASGVDTIPAGSSVTLTNYAGTTGHEVTWEWAAAADPGADAEVEVHQGWSSGTGQQFVKAYERGGNTGIEIVWRVLHR